MLNWSWREELGDRAKREALDGLEKYTALKLFDVSGNNLRFGLAGLEVCSRLEELEARNCKLRSLEGLGRLRRLRRVDVSENLIEQIPKQLSLLKDLRWLDVSSNRICVLSELQNLVGCKNLFRASFAGNAVCESPDYRRTVLSKLRTLCILDGVDVQTEDVDTVSKARDKEKTDGTSCAKTNEEFLALMEENKQIRVELEATSQLLARKTAEWAVAEEQSSRLEQDLAFFRIDHPGREHQQAPSALPKKSLTLPEDEARNLEGLLEENAKSLHERLRPLQTEMQNAENELETIENLLDVARDKVTKAREMVLEAQNSEEDQHGIANSYKQGLEILRDLCSKKVEFLQELLVIDTNRLVEGGGADIISDNDVNERTGVQMALETSCEEISSILARNEYVELLADFPRDTDSSMEGISALSERVEHAQEQEKFVLQVLQAPVKNNRLAVRKDVLRADEEEERALKQEHESLRVRIQELENAILKIEVQAYKRESELRARQCGILRRIVDHKDATLDACNRTITRLQHDLEKPCDRPSKQTTRKRQERDDVVGTELRQHDEDRARQCRKQVYEEILKSEKGYVHDLNTCVELFLVPMWRRALLSPRELLVICNNLEMIRDIHEELLGCLEKERDAKVILGAFDTYVAEFDVYRTYKTGFVDSIALLASRSSQVEAFASFLKQTQEQNRGRTLQSLFALPLKRIAQYHAYFSRLLALHQQESMKTLLHKKLLGLKMALEHILQSIEGADVHQMFRQANACALLQRLNNSKYRDWIAREVPHNRYLVAQPDIVDIEFQEEKFRNMKSLFIFNDIVLFAIEPSQWCASFSGELPRLKPLFVLLGGHFHVQQDDILHEDSATIEDGFPSVCLESSQHGLVLIRFPNTEQYHIALHAFQNISEVKSGAFDTILATKESKNGISKQGAYGHHAGNGGSPSSSSQPEQSSWSKLPGTDMIERRKLAQSMAKKRGAWISEHKEKPLAREAKARIAKRDGNPVPQFEKPPIQAKQVTRPKFALSRRTYHTPPAMQKPRSFDPIYHNQPALTTSKKNKNRPRDRPAPIICFDDGDVEQIDLSIFRAPKRKNTHQASAPTTPGQRFIGLDWQASEYIKERHHIEQKFGNT